MSPQITSPLAEKKPSASLPSEFQTTKEEETTSAVNGSAAGLSASASTDAVPPAAATVPPEKGETTAAEAASVDGTESHSANEGPSNKSVPITRLEKTFPLNDPPPVKDSLSNMLEKLGVGNDLLSETPESLCLENAAAWLKAAAMPSLERHLVIGFALCASKEIHLFAEKLFGSIVDYLRARLADHNADDNADDNALVSAIVFANVTAAYIVDGYKRETDNFSPRFKFRNIVAKAFDGLMKAAQVIKLNIDKPDDIKAGVNTEDLPDYLKALAGFQEAIFAHENTIVVSLEAADEETSELLDEEILVAKADTTFESLASYIRGSLKLRNFEEIEGIGMVVNDMYGNHYPSEKDPLSGFLTEYNKFFLRVKVCVVGKFGGTGMETSQEHSLSYSTSSTAQTTETTVTMSESEFADVAKAVAEAAGALKDAQVSLENARLRSARSSPQTGSSDGKPLPKRTKRVDNTERQHLFFDPVSPTPVAAAQRDAAAQSEVAAQTGEADAAGKSPVELAAEMGHKPAEKKSILEEIEVGEGEKEDVDDEEIDNLPMWAATQAVDDTLSKLFTKDTKDDVPDALNKLWDNILFKRDIKIEKDKKVVASVTIAPRFILDNWGAITKDKVDAAIKDDMTLAKRIEDVQKIVAQDPAIKSRLRRLVTIINEVIEEKKTEKRERASKLRSEWRATRGATRAYRDVFRSCSEGFRNRSTWVLKSFDGFIEFGLQDTDATRAHLDSINKLGRDLVNAGVDVRGDVDEAEKSLLAAIRAELEADVAPDAWEDEERRARWEETVTMFCRALVYRGVKGWEEVEEVENGNLHERFPFLFLLLETGYVCRSKVRDYEYYLPKTSLVGDVTPVEVEVLKCLVELHINFTLRREGAPVPLLPWFLCHKLTYDKDGKNCRLFTGKKEEVTQCMFSMEPRRQSGKSKTKLMNPSSLDKTGYHILFRGKGVKAEGAAELTRLLEEKNLLNKGDLLMLGSKKRPEDAKIYFYDDKEKYDKEYDKEKKKESTYDAPFPAMLIRSALGGNSDEIAVRATWKEKNTKGELVEYNWPASNKTNGRHLQRQVEDHLMPVLDGSSSSVPLTSTGLTIRCLPSYLGGISPKQMPDSAFVAKEHESKKGFVTRRVFLPYLVDAKPTERDILMYYNMLNEVVSVFSSDNPPTNMKDFFVLPAFQELTCSRQVAVIGICALVSLKLVLPWLMSKAPYAVMTATKPLLCIQACEQLINWVNEYSESQEGKNKYCPDRRLKYLIVACCGVPPTITSLTNWGLLPKEIGILRSAPALLRTFVPTRSLMVPVETQRRRSVLMKGLNAGFDGVLRGGGDAKKGIGGALAFKLSKPGSPATEIDSAAPPSQQGSTWVALFVLRFSQIIALSRENSGAAQLVSTLWELWATLQPGGDDHARKHPVQFGVAQMTGSKNHVDELDIFMVAIPKDGATHEAIIDVLSATNQNDFSERITDMFKSEKVSKELRKILMTECHTSDCVHYEEPGKSKEVLHIAARKFVEMTKLKEPRVVVCASALDRIVAHTLTFAVENHSVHAICTPDTSALRAVYAKRNQPLRMMNAVHVHLASSEEDPSILSDCEVMMRCYAASTAQYSVTIAASGKMVGQRDTRAGVYSEVLTELDTFLESVAKIETRNDTLGTQMLEENSGSSLPQVSRDASTSQSKLCAVILLRKSTSTPGLPGEAYVRALENAWRSQFDRAQELVQSVRDQNGIDEYNEIFVVFADGVKGTENLPIEPDGRVRVTKQTDGDGLLCLVRKAYSTNNADAVFNKCPVEFATKPSTEYQKQNIHVFVPTLSRVSMPGALDKIRESGCRFFSWDLWLVSKQLPDNLKLDGDLSVRLDEPRVARLLRAVVFGDFLWRVHTQFRMVFWAGVRLLALASRS